ncbi:MAG: hypothetical protein CBARDMAM_4786 [uncultured Caballeronia sp.]|nr:MAG: hypothetical protein CBARDMAM_4786 [uncultured Caballeronia sp.]
MWKGAADWYRNWARHGGILSQFDDPWFDGQVASRQYGAGESGGKNRVTGELMSGPETLPPKVLETTVSSLTRRN